MEDLRIGCRLIWRVAFCRGRGRLMPFAQAEEARSVPAGPGDLLCDDREALVCATLPQKPAGYHYHFVALPSCSRMRSEPTLIWRCLSGPVRKRAQHTSSRGAQPAECPFLKAVSQRSRKRSFSPAGGSQRCSALQSALS